MKYGDNPELDRRLSSLDKPRKSISKCLYAAALEGIDHNKRWLDLVPDCLDVTLILKYDRRTGEARFVDLWVKTEREITD